MSTVTLSPRVRPAYPTAPAGQLRLTRRGRVVVLLVALLAVLAAGIWLATGAVGTGESGTPTPTETVVVGPGETLWSIADEAAGSAPTADMVDRITELNALDSSMLVAGQRLNVPTSAE